MEDSKHRRRLLQRILMGWVVVTGAMPVSSVFAEKDSLTIREPSFEQSAVLRDRPAFHAIREPVAAPTFRPVREPNPPSIAQQHLERPAAISRPAALERPAALANGASPAARLTPPSAATLPPLPGTSDSLAAGTKDDRRANSEEARWLRKLSLAQQVSSEILGVPQASPTAPPRPNVSTMTSRRLAQQAAERLAQARSQSNRGTLLSAQRSAFETLRLIADANDLLEGNVFAATALQQARTALHESEDFAGRFGLAGPDAIARMAASHQTPILQNCDTSQLNGNRATDIYLDYARAKLADVAEANPIAIEALVVLAQVERQTETPGPVADAVVISLLRAALQAGPNDPVVANELGFQLLKQGLLEEAQWALEHSFRLQPTRSAGVNLAETLRQRGDMISARAMIAKLEQIPVAPPRSPDVYTLTPQQFAALSQRTAPPRSEFAPRGAAPAPAANVGPLPATANTGPTPAAPVQPAEPRGPVGRVADAVSQLWK